MTWGYCLNAKTKGGPRGTIFGGFQGFFFGVISSSSKLQPFSIIFIFGLQGNEWDGWHVLGAIRVVWVSVPGFNTLNDE